MLEFDCRQPRTVPAPADDLSASPCRGEIIMGVTAHRDSQRQFRVES
jgi:hypothetical protein